MRDRTGRFLFPSLKLAIAGWLTSSALLAGPIYVQTNLVSDIPGLAAFTNPNLLNPWGTSFSATSPFWVSNQASNTATLFGSTSNPVALVVSVAGGPTGQVFNSTGASNFEISGTAATFLFATLAGTIEGWDGGLGTTAQVAATVSGAVFTGLALDSTGGSPFLYAADNHGGGIDVFGSTFTQVSPGGNFTDPNLPAGYKPYNIQNIGGNLYVEYDSSAGPVLGNGVVAVFDANGNFLKELISGGQLDMPWGITLAPPGFGMYSNDLLVGNFGNGEINAFDPVSGMYLGTLSDGGGNPIVNQDLWSLSTRTASGFDTGAVYFTAGINGETDGLFGQIDFASAPEPGSLSLLGFGLLAMTLVIRRLKRNR